MKKKTLAKVSAKAAAVFRDMKKKRLFRLIFDHFFLDGTNQNVSVLQPLQFLTISDIFVQ
jgi:hypothetical protein